MENLLSVLPLLACPIGMGLMMWFMMRMNKSQDAASAPAATAPASATSAAVADDRLAGLRVQLEEVHAQQAAIAAQIERLSTASEPTDPADLDRTGPAAETNWKAGGQS
jgi:2,4-dienoyl-CoA reductase-like NADH-dependent reductase (Old Yellow Enzyme family)